MTSKEISKIIVQRALERRYGFKPSRSSIKLMAKNGSNTHIEFHVNGHYYIFNSILMSDGSVWISEDSVEKHPEYDV